MPMARLDGGNIHYTIRGEGRPMVMLLPQSSGPIGVAPFIEALSKRCMVICYDQRGTGQSAPGLTSDAMSMAGRAEEVLGLLNALNIEQATLCCHSTGCGIGIAATTNSPAKVAGLILMSPWAYADAHLTTMQELRIAAARALDSIQYARFNASLLFPPAYRRAHQEGFERMATAAVSAPQDAEQISNRLQAILAYDTRPLVPSIICPTLIATAEDDQLMPAWFGRDMARDIPNATLIELAGGGHMIPETRGDELSIEIIKFIEKL
jgi:aminoacrylate hydrolase